MCTATPMYATVLCGLIDSVMKEQEMGNLGVVSSAGDNNKKDLNFFVSLLYIYYVLCHSKQRNPLSH